MLNFIFASMKKLVFISGFLLLLAGCSNTPGFKETRTFDNHSWSRFKTLEFKVPVKQSGSFDFDLDFTYDSVFNYDRLWVNITFYTPDGTTRSRDYGFDLYDKNGNKLGKEKNNGWEVSLPVIHGMLLSDTGTCRVRIENQYPKYETGGIVELGLKVSKNKQ